MGQCGEHEKLALEEEAMLNMEHTMGFYTQPFETVRDKILHRWQGQLRTTSRTRVESLLNELCTSPADVVLAFKLVDSYAKIEASSEYSLEKLILMAIVLCEDPAIDQKLKTLWIGIDKQVVHKAGQEVELVHEVLTFKLEEKIVDVLLLAGYHIPLLLFSILVWDKDLLLIQLERVSK